MDNRSKIHTLREPVVTQVAASKEEGHAQHDDILLVLCKCFHLAVRIGLIYTSLCGSLLIVIQSFPGLNLRNHKVMLVAKYVACRANTLVVIFEFFFACWSGCCVFA